MLPLSPRLFDLPLVSAPFQEAVGVVSSWEAEEVNYEGLRVAVDEGNGRAGWFMNRLSLHEPIVIFYVESVRNPLSLDMGGTKRFRPFFPLLTLVSHLHVKGTGPTRPLSYPIKWCSRRQAIVSCVRTGTRL